MNGVRSLVMLSLLWSVSLFAGTTGDYVGVTKVEKWIYEEVIKDSSFNYPSWTVTYDTIPYDSVVISSFFTLDGKEAYERYSYKYHSGGTTSEERDTLYENGSEMWVKLGVYTIDTAFRSYVTPLSVGDVWDMGMGGIYTDDFDHDGTEDTMIVSHDTTQVISYGSFTVPAGVYDAYELYRTGRVELRTSTQPQTIEWVFEHERFVPELGIIYDSIIVIDSVAGFETHVKYDVSKLLGAVKVIEGRNNGKLSIGKTVITHTPVIRLDGVRNAVLYSINGAVVDNNVKGTIRLPEKGVFVLKGVNTSRKAVIFKIVYR